MNQATLWKTTLEELQLRLSPADFKTWFCDTMITSCTQRDGCTYIEVGTSNSFSASRLKTKYSNDIRDSLKKTLNTEVELNFVTKTKPIENKPLGPLFSKPEKIQKQQNDSGLNQDYTFDTFVVGGNNRLAHAVAMSVAENPGSYNPFFLYSGVGLGKTHLIHAIGNRIIEQYANLKVFYTTTEMFMNDLLKAIQNKDQASFKQKYRTVDVLLLDDVQFVAGKEATQEELFNTFNTLYMANKQIVLTSDRPPKDIAHLEERLSSRFSGGMITDMQAPDTDIRLAILQSKENKFNHYLLPEVLEFIANSIRSNIRELEGAFKQIMLFEKATGYHIDVVEAEKMLQSNLTTNKNQPLNPQDIIRVVCDFFAISTKDLKGHRRPQHLVYPRQISMYLLGELTELPLMGIGDHLGGRDHTTIMHGIAVIKKKMQADDKLKQQINLIKEKLII